jgi:hypothetical protein
MIRAILEQPVEVGPEWKMFRLSGRAGRDYARREFDAAMHFDAAKQVLDLEPLFVLEIGLAR